MKIVLSTHEDIDVVDTASDGFEVLKCLEKYVVDVILMDIRMPSMECYGYSGSEGKYPNTKIIILTTFDDDDFVFSALRYGASGYLLKGVSMDELYKAIVTVNTGGAMINPDIATKVFSMFSKMQQNNYTIKVDEKDVETLSKPEWKVIQHVAMAYPIKKLPRNSSYLKEL